MVFALWIEFLNGLELFFIINVNSHELYIFYLFHVVVVPVKFSWFSDFLRKTNAVREQPFHGY
jgi:hypothetical protein